MNIKRYVPSGFKRKIRSISDILKYNRFLLFFLSPIYKKNIYDTVSDKNIFLIGVTSHNNIGDHAITYSEICFFKKYFFEYNLVIIEEKQAYKYVAWIHDVIKENDIIALHGGGNVGIEYFSHELIRRTIISSFPHSKIVIMPQTIDFGKSKKGMAELKKSSRIYSRHKHLLFLLREEYSFNISRKYFSCRQMLVPDIVLSQHNHIYSKKPGNKVIVCLRSDVEKSTSPEFGNLLSDCLIKTGCCIEYADNIADRDYAHSDGAKVWKKYMKKLSSADMIVTDRLHTMIFCHLLNVRCIALSNYNNKVKGVYQKWLKYDLNIFFCGTEKDVFDYIENKNVTGIETKECLNDYDDIFLNVAEEIRSI